MKPDLNMINEIPAALGLIAGRGAYPLLLAAGARRSGVRRIVAVALRGETDPAIKQTVDEVVWLRVGQLEATLDAFRSRAIRQVVMAGQITPGNIFNLRLDRRALMIFMRLKERNARTIFGAICDELKAEGIELLPAYCFMEDAMPPAGLLTRRAPTEREQADIALGLRAAKATSALEIGQTVAVKDGIILAVEAFEGTDATILRAGKLGGANAVIVKVARLGHDMRYDIPVIGPRTLDMLAKIKASVLAMEARRTILLEREHIIEKADRFGITMIAVEPANEKTAIEPQDPCAAERNNG